MTAFFLFVAPFCLVLAPWPTPTTSTTLLLRAGFNNGVGKSWR